MSQSTGALRARIEFFLTRILVPLWILSGALFKLYERVPSNLPKVIFDPAKRHNIDLDVLLRSLIGLELLAVGVMVFIPRFARAMAIFMLSCFCLILAGEMRLRAEKCGCFGSLPMKPWHMLLIDGSLLLAILVCSFRPRSARPAIAPTSRSLAKPALIAVVLLALGLGVAFAVPARPSIDQAVKQPEPGVPNDPNQNPNPSPVPPFFSTPADVQVWVGKKWRELSIFKLMPKWPADLDKGKHYVVFYSRTCEHCEAMFNEDLIIPQSAPVIAVEIPASREMLTDSAAWPMPQNVCQELLSLPLGCQWSITAPLTLTIEDGIVTCATEGDHRKCMGLL